MEQPLISPHVRDLQAKKCVSIHHDQNVRTSLCTFLSIAILTNAAIPGAPYRRETAEGHG